MLSTKELTIFSSVNVLNLINMVKIGQNNLWMNKTIKKKFNCDKVIIDTKTTELYNLRIRKSYLVYYDV